MLTIRQTLLSMLLFSVGTVTAEDNVKTTCTPPANTADPHLDYLIFIERSGNFCTSLVDGKFADSTMGHKDPVFTISYTRTSLQGSECGKLKRDDCLKSLKGLADTCRYTQTFEFPTDTTTYLQGSSTLPTTCGTYKVTISPRVTQVGGLNSTNPLQSTSPPDTSGKARDPNLTDNSGDNAYVSEWEDDGSGYVRKKNAAGRMGAAVKGWWMLGAVVVVGLGGFW